MEITSRPAGNRRCSMGRGQQGSPQGGAVVGTTRRNELPYEKRRKVWALGNTHISRGEESTIDKVRTQKRASRLGGHQEYNF